MMAPPTIIVRPDALNALGPIACKATSSTNGITFWIAKGPNEAAARTRCQLDQQQGLSTQFLGVQP
jgi:hypothetical protein